MRWLLVVIVLGACAPALRRPPANIAVVSAAEPVPEVVIDPDSENLRDKRSYWKKWSRAYMSQVPGPVCICESKPSFTYDSPTGPKTSYMTTCSTYR